MYQILTFLSCFTFEMFPSNQLLIKLINFLKTFFFLHSVPCFPLLIRIFLSENIVDQIKHVKVPQCQGASVFLGPIVSLGEGTWARDIYGSYNQLNICANF